MRVLLLSDFFPPVKGGLERHVDALAATLAQLGHEVHVATCTAAPVPSHPAVTTHVVPTAASRVLRFADADRPFHPPAPDPLARRALRSILERVRPDVIHGHSWLTVSLPADRDAPLIFTAHDYGTVCPKRTLLRRDGSVCGGPRGLGCVPCGAGQYGALRSSIIAPLTYLGRPLLRADRVLAVSSAVADALRPHLTAPIQVVPNFMASTSGTTSVTAGVLPAGPFAMYAGDPGPHKGLGTLLEAWDEQVPAALFLAMTRPGKHPLPTYVRTGTLPADQMPAAWAAASIAVVPSLWPEPCPTVVLEAMRAGTPVVASNIGGMTELVQDGVDGLLVPPGDASALRTAVLSLLADPARRAHLGDAARRRAESFTAAAVVPTIVACYEQAVAVRHLVDVPVGQD